MPQRTDIESILIIGAGPIVIGQACEFDYSGAQACKALREAGYRVILVNSNPATIMTDPAMADATYIEPINWETVANIIDKERPDAVLPTMGGQTALNCALDLQNNGVLDKYNVELIGASYDAIHKAEDRDLFDKAMRKIGLECARAKIVHSLSEAMEVPKEFGFPCIIRPSFTMGGSGCWAGKSSKWKWCETKTTIASLCVPSKTSTPWGFTPATLLPLPLRKPLPIRNTRLCETLRLQCCVKSAWKRAVLMCSLL